MSGTGERARRIVLVRHGETEWSRDGLHTGRSDIPLTDRGRRQGEALRPCLQAWSFGRVLTSPMQRAMQTCRLAGLAGQAEVREDLAEWDYGEYDGKATAEIRRNHPGWTVWTGDLPGGETAEQVGARADRLIEELRVAQGDVALFGHGHFFRVLGARWIGLPPDRGRSFALDAAAICVLGHERETPVLWSWNEQCRQKD